MDAYEDEQCVTVTVALELDDGVSDLDIVGSERINGVSPPFKQHEDPKSFVDNFARIGPRVRPSEVCPQVNDVSLKLCDLSVDAVRLLDLRLNPYAIGTLKNWEFVCAQLGASMDEIANLRSTPNPTARMLNMFQNVTIRHFLDILCTMNRIDVLISLTKFIEKLQRVDKLAAAENDRRYSRAETAVFVSGMFSSFQLDDETDNVLLLHHETSKDSRKYFKYLRENLCHQCRISNEIGQRNGRRLQVLDVKNCVDEFNVYDSNQRLFDRAYAVVVIFNADYLREVVHHDTLERSANFGSNAKESMLAITILLHRLTNNEYIRNEMRNRRFRAVLMPGTERSALPNGWASNTLVYSFPEDYAQLCRKLFGVGPPMQPPNRHWPHNKKHNSI